jgi:hypothetical protein
MQSLNRDWLVEVKPLQGVHSIAFQSEWESPIGQKEIKPSIACASFACKTRQKLPKTLGIPW